MLLFFYIGDIIISGFRLPVKEAERIIVICRGAGTENPFRPLPFRIADRFHHSAEHRSTVLRAGSAVFVENDHGNFRVVCREESGKPCPADLFSVFKDPALGGACLSRTAFCTDRRRRSGKQLS